MPVMQMSYKCARMKNKLCLQLSIRNLKINLDKSRHSASESEGREMETYKKGGSLIGNSDDIFRREELAIVSSEKLDRNLYLETGYLNREDQKHFDKANSSL